MTQGLHATVINGPNGSDCLVIGQRIPRVHGGDGKPVYLVVEHPDGLPLLFVDGSTHKLLAYPSAWPGPRLRGSAFIYAKHPDLPWNAPVPVFDREEALQ